MFVIVFIFYTSIVLGMLKYINRSLFFIRPMTKKYKIMAPDLHNNIKNRYFIMFIFNIIIFAILLFSFFLLSYYQHSIYKKYDILEYINEFSDDLFDWRKIYDLNIPEDIKKSCFLIHNKNYEEFRKLYIYELNMEKDFITDKIEKLKKYEN